MRTKIMIVLLALVLAALNYNIYEKEQIKKHGETLLLELTSTDPRSLIQGDYMHLRYTIEHNVSSKKLASHQKRGYIVVRPDKNNVAQFVRFHEEEDLALGEKLLCFHEKYHGVRIVPDSFFLQEGYAKYYENAKYGVFKFNDPDQYLLVGLADANRKIISIS